MNSKLWTSAPIKFSFLIVVSCCNSQHQFHKSCVSFNTVRTVNVESPHRTVNVASKDVHFLISKYTCDRVSAQILDPKLEVMIQKLILKTKQLHCLYMPNGYASLSCFTHRELLLSLFSLTEGSS